MSIYLPSIFLSIPRNTITAVGLPLTLGILSGSTTSKVVRGEWYKNLATPPGRPPRQVFPIIWPLLYISMGHASHLAVKALDSTPLSSWSIRSDLTLGLALYYAQLVLNCAWSPLFFGAKQVGLALVDSILLTGTVFYMTKILDAPTSSRSTYVLVPYCVWLTFATYLNGGIWWLNRKRR